MNFLEQVAKWIGVELNKPFQVYDGQAAYVTTAVFKPYRDGCQLQVIPEDDDCIDPNAVLGGLRRNVN